MLLTTSALTAGCAKSSEPPVPLPAKAASVSVSPDNYGTLWLTTAGPVYSSSDGGHKWRRVPGSLAGGTIGFGAKQAYQYAGSQARVGNQSGLSLHPFPAAPVPLVAVTSPYYLTHRLYGLDAQGGLWMSVNAGRAWSRLRAQGLPPGGIALAARRQDPILPDTIYVAEGARGLWKSTDYGATFHRLAGVASATAVALTAHNAKRVLVADSRGLLLSKNDGASFQRVLTLPGITAVALDTRNYQNAFATTRGGELLRSDDGGASWQE